MIIFDVCYVELILHLTYSALLSPTQHGKSKLRSSRRVKTPPSSKSRQNGNRGYEVDDLKRHRSRSKRGAPESRSRPEDSSRIIKRAKPRLLLHHLPLSLPCILPENQRKKCAKKASPDCHFRFTKIWKSPPERN